MSTADDPQVSAISHITVTVTDVERSVEWYCRALGMQRVRDMSGPGWIRTLVAANGVMFGLQRHDTTRANDRFDETRVGVDHISLACTDRAEIEAWAAALDERGIEHSPLSPAPSNVMTAADPDGIRIEFFAPATA